ncbi:hypothetical protein NPA31_011755 [Aurantimonas sp. MSK8Z-1]|uniref:hypothetical protein n=1 Tax=Mangrovibrevibacter kandeliae TaxID=2968473 RepID=UPI002117AAC3|nr:hypothetical protein [Aurantimonas sp. MSK8Z-1]MCW4115638.1 hypothetical protein [Aurantimonas sp. MSK8Z-1]
MGFFQHLEGDAAILVENGVYKQADLYQRDGFLFARTSGGFVRLMADGSTSKARLRLDVLSVDQPLHRDAVGRLCLPTAAGARLLSDDRKRALLGGPQ